MLTAATAIFLQRPEDFTARLLHPGVAIEVNETRITVSLDEALDVEAGQELLVYFEMSREFVQQPGRVTRGPYGDLLPDRAGLPESPADPRLLVDFETTGHIMSAESRQHYRVTTINAALEATLGDEACALIDVSASGFSVLSRARYAHGDVVEATLSYAYKSFTGAARIQSIKTLVRGDTRYGLTGLESGRGSIGQGQERITMAVQREQLRRNSGR